MTEVDKRAQVEEEEELSPREKAAILMIALGEEAAGEIMKYMVDFEIEEITQIITELNNLPTAIQDRVLEEFEQHLIAGEWVSQGGIDFARQPSNAPSAPAGPRKYSTESIAIPTPASTCSKTWHRSKSRPLLATNTRRPSP